MAPRRVFEDEALEEAIVSHRGNVSAVARHLGVTKRSVYMRLRKERALAQLLRQERAELQRLISRS